MTIFEISFIIVAVGLIGAGFVGITNNPISRYLMKDLEERK